MRQAIAHWVRMPVRAGADFLIGHSLLETRYRDTLKITFQKKVQTQWRWVGDTKPCQQLAVITITNCSICLGGRGEKAFPGTAIQMPNLILSQPVRLQQDSTPAAHLLFQPHCQGLDLES